METLASRIARDGALNEAEAAGWIIRLAKELEPIHSLGVAHGNITAEALKIGGSPQTSQGFLADAGRVPNLVAYHSPERAGGEAISPASDTWAVAVTLYLALTGSLPFPGKDDHEVKRRILGAPPSPLAVFDVGDDDLQQILDRAFSRDPATRLMSLFELRRALEEWHPDPEAKKLPRLDVGDKEPPSSAQPPLSARSALLATDLAPDDDDGDGPTMVRHVSSFQEYLDAPPAVPAAPPVQRERPGVLKGRAVPTPSRPLPVPEPPPRRRPEPAAASLLPFDSENEPATAILQSPFTPPSQRPTAPLPIPTPPSQPAPSPPASSPPASSRTAPSPPASSRTVPSPPASSPTPPSQPAPNLSPLIELTPLPEMAVPVSRRELLAAPETSGMAAPAAAQISPVAPAHSVAPAPPPAGVLVEGHPPIEPAQPRESQAKGLSKPLAFGLVLLLACGAAAFFFLRPPPAGTTTASSAAPSAAAVAPSASSAAASATPSAPVTASGATPSATASATSSATASATSSATASATPSATASATASAASSASPSAAPAACLMPLFAAGTFTDPPERLDGLCAITDPRKGGEVVRTEVVRGGSGRSVSDGMREWAVLGLYEMAAFALLRATCCSSPAPLSLPVSVPACDVDTPLKNLAAVASSADADDAKVLAAVEAYTTAARCISRAGANDAFGQKSGLQGGEALTFQKTLDRVRAVVKKK